MCVQHVKLGDMDLRQIWGFALNALSVSTRLGRSQLQYAMIAPLVLIKGYQAPGTAIIVYQEHMPKVQVIRSARLALLVLQLLIPPPRHVLPATWGNTPLGTATKLV